MADVVLTTTDAITRTISSDDDQTVLQAAKACGTVLPELCGTGSCGTCRATVTAGEYRMLAYEAEALGSSENGAVLLCRTVAESDLEVSLPYDSSRVLDSAPAERRATITELATVAPNIVRLRMQLEATDEYGSGAQFEAGQYFQLEEPASGMLRAYSVSNLANWDGELEFLIHLREGGVFSEFLRTRAAVGDVVRVVGPQGSFGLIENGFTPRWFVGGGCGLAPLLAMLRRMADWGDGQDARLYLGINTGCDMFGTSEIIDLLDRLPQLEVVTAVWHPDGELPPAPAGRWTMVEGTSVDALRADLADAPEIPDIYVCGPPGMVTALETVASDIGVSQHVYSERIAQN